MPEIFGIWQQRSKYKYYNDIFCFLNPITNKMAIYPLVLEKMQPDVAGSWSPVIKRKGEGGQHRAYISFVSLEELKNLHTVNVAQVNPDYSPLPPPPEGKKNQPWLLILAWNIK